MFECEKSKFFYTLFIFIILSSYLSIETFAVFEQDLIYSLGADSLSLGAGAVANENNAWGFIDNPALVCAVKDKNLGLAFGVMRNEIPQNRYKYYIFSYTNPCKHALAVTASSTLNPPSRDILTYSFGHKIHKKLFYGVNINLLKFNIQSSEDTGFSADFGAYTYITSKLKYGLAVKNLISSLSTTYVTGEEKKLSPFLTTGFSYPFGSLNIFAGFRTLLSPPSSYKFSGVSIGLEYKYPKALSFKGSASQNDLINGRRDRLAAGGISLQTPSLDLSFSSIVNDEGFDKISASSINYYMWASKSKKRKLAQSAQQPVEKPDVLLEKPLPVLEKEPRQTEKEKKKKEKGEETLLSGSKKKIILEEPEKLQNFSVIPNVIITNSPERTAFTDISQHWCAPYVNYLSAKGFFSKIPNENFQPDSDINSSEFYRLLLLFHLYSVFRERLVLSDSDSDFSALVSISLVNLDDKNGSNIEIFSDRRVDNIAEGIIVEPSLLDEKLLMPGTYKIVMKAITDYGRTFIGEDVVTILDTSIDVSSLSKLSSDERKQAVSKLVQDLNAIGLDVSYIEKIFEDISISRLNALREIFNVLKISHAIELRNEDLHFTDVQDLSDSEKKILFFSTRGFKSLNGVSIVSGYSDGAFKPNKPLTKAEATVIFTNVIRLDKDDFKPPYAEPSKGLSFVDAGMDFSGSEGGAMQMQPNRYYLIAASYVVYDNAKNAREELKGYGFAPFIVEEFVGEGMVYHVVLDVFNTEREAEEEKKNLSLLPYSSFIKTIHKRLKKGQEIIPTTAKFKIKIPDYTPSISLKVPLNFEMENMPLPGEQIGSYPEISTDEISKTGVEIPSWANRTNKSNVEAGNVSHIMPKYTIDTEILNKFGGK